MEQDGRRETANYLVDSIMEKLHKFAPSNLDLIANLLFLCLANDLEIKMKRTMDGPKAEKAVILDAVKEKLTDGKDEFIMDTVQFFYRYSIGEEGFAIAGEQIVENGYWHRYLPKILDYLIDVKWMPEMASEFQTEAPLNILALAILNPVKGTFYDGTAGGGRTAVEAYRYAQDQGGSLEVYTQEINEFLFHVSLLRFFIEKMPGVHLACGNTISDPAYAKEDQLQTFDYSVMFPPIGAGKTSGGNVFLQDRYHRFDFAEGSGVNSEWMFALHQAASLNDTGRGVVCMSGGSLFNAQTKDVRAHMIRLGLIECIISFPMNTLGYSAVPVNLVVFNKNHRHNDEILMIDVRPFLKTNAAATNKKRYVLTDEAIRHITEIYTKREEVDEISILVKSADLTDHNLLPARYINKITVETKEFGEVGISQKIGSILESGNWKRLDEVADIFPGVNNSKISVEDDEGEFRIVKLSDVQDGRLEFENMRLYRLMRYMDYGKYLIRKGDTIVSCKGPAVKVCFVDDTDENVMISGTFVGIRPRPDRIDPLYLKYFLESPLGLYLLRSRQAGSSIIMIKTSDIKNIPVPYIPLEAQIHYSMELQQKEDRLKRQIAALQKDLKRQRINFYSQIGTSDLMNIREEDTDE